MSDRTNKEQPITESEKIKLTSMDVSAEKRRQLKSIFPEVFNEDKIDFAQLKRVLGTWVDSEKEHFGLHWPGKAESIKTIQKPSQATLKPAVDESLNFAESEHVFIEGDNLEVLKLLQKSYFGKVRTIYIDPPYNTGKEFVYTDKYSQSMDSYLAFSGQLDGQGKKLAANTEVSGRYHSNWLNMMFPRLYLAKNLLSEEGCIIVSIDDHEYENLKAICNMVFGEENFVGNFIWTTKKAAQGMATKNMLVSNHEYLLLFAKNSEVFKFRGLQRSPQSFSNPDNDPRGLWKRQYLQRLGQGLPERTLTDPETGNSYTFETPYTQEKLEQWIQDGRIMFASNKAQYPARKEFLSEYQRNQQLVTYLGLFPTKSNSEDLYKLFDSIKVFTNPKPLDLIRFCIEQTTDKNSLIMDFFAGSGSTAHAVFDLNKTDGGTRKFICVQLQEPTAKKSEAYKAGYKNIADICKERIRRAANNIGQSRQLDHKDSSMDSSGVDLGFKVFKLAQSNFKIWDVNKTKAMDAQLAEHIEPVDCRSSQEDILYELLLKAGFPLTIAIEKITLAGKELFAIAAGKILVCLEQELDQVVIDAMAATKPMRVICLDSGFNGNDQLKLNAIQTFKMQSYGQKDEIVFQTV